MDGVRFGRQLRALRRRRRWPQEDVGTAAGLSRSLVGRIEQGPADRVTVRTLERVAAALGARVVCRLDWNGEALDRLLDAGHAAIVERVVRILTADGWQCATEVSFNTFGERGSIDILAFHPPTRALLVVEVKSVVPDVQLTLVTLDRKGRLAMRVAAQRAWQAASVARVLVLGESRTSRRRLAANKATFRSVLPEGTWAVRRWIGAPHPDQPVAGIWFLSPATQEIGRHRVTRRAARRCG